jgi:4-hydroxy-tetrahydrodipicolinate synthase
MEGAASMSGGRTFGGVIPAMAVPFRDDYKIDDDRLARFARWLAGCRGVTALMTNGHTGEVGSLLPEERAEVTRIVADATKSRVRVISAICAEGTFEAIEHARAAAHAGADAVDVMPCHMWLRFGVKEDAVYEYVKAIGGESGLDVVVHVYPASTKAAYSTRLMVRLAGLPQVKAFKMGERDLGRYERDIRALRAETPHVALLNCMDEYLFPTFVHRMDGTLVGCASLIPELTYDLFAAMAADDLTRAREINDRIWPIKEAVYGAGEPSGDAHARMKEGMVLRGIFRSALARPPVLPPSADEIAAMQAALTTARVPAVDLV